ncbi:glycosyltransferase family 4 protein [Belliella sp. R4-6]|uniref:Glycosyltransferase family 4 protein n=1 Tax=Belliella alkalica TaxID=1730871 RepID=A0ABS9V6K8_9BACT|nr:glycosyltransferase family 4 protein [Belliella alkalica]MCH7412056.1 glycosyltransferase family 4 protein [Belliella alkalica]
MKPKILFTASIAKHILRFHLPYLQWFQQQGYETHVACNGDEQIPFVDVKHTIPFIRSPFHLGHFVAYKELKNLLHLEQFDMVHCHTPMASVVTRLAAKSSRKKSSTKIIYTAHGFHFFKGGPIHSWLTYYPVELFLARHTDAIITINEEDFQLIKQKENSTTKVFKIPGIGVSQKRFFPVNLIEKKVIRKKNNFSQDDFILVYAAEFITRKNHEFIVSSVANLINAIPSIKILFAGRGELLEDVKGKVSHLKLQDYIKFLGFREDIDEVFKMSDVGISASKQEGLGLNLVEEMMCGLPIVASEDRGHREIVENDLNGYLFPQNDVHLFVKCIQKLFENSLLRDTMSLNAIETAKKFELSNSLNEMSVIYKQILNK